MSLSTKQLTALKKSFGIEHAEALSVIKAWTFNPHPDIAHIAAIIDLWNYIERQAAHTIENEASDGIGEELLCEYISVITNIPCRWTRSIEGMGRGIYPMTCTYAISDGVYSIYRLLNTNSFTWTGVAWKKSNSIFGQILPASTNPLDYCGFKKLPHEKGGTYEEEIVYYGVELEVNPNATHTLSAMAVETHKDLGIDFAILKADSSIGNGFEIVTAPATLAYHKKAWLKFFENSAKNLVSWGTNCCGMHVHISRSGFTGPTHLGKMLAFYNAPHNKAFIERIAGRTNSKYAVFNTKENALLAKMLKETTDKSNIPINAALKFENAGNKYRVVNLKKPHTVEVRIFRGNVSKVGFFKNLEFVDAAFEYSKVFRYNSMSPSELKMYKHRLKNKAVGQEMEVYGITFEDFLKWLTKDNTGKYTCLKLWLHKAGILTDSGINVKVLDKVLRDKITAKNNGIVPLKFSSDVEINAVA